jgi:hypothetical protein
MIDFRDISKKNLKRVILDKKIRLYYIFVILLILSSTGILA